MSKRRKSEPSKSEAVREAVPPDAGNDASTSDALGARPGRTGVKRERRDGDNHWHPPGDDDIEIVWYEVAERGFKAQLWVVEWEKLPYSTPKGIRYRYEKVNSLIVDVLVEVGGLARPFSVRSETDIDPFVSGNFLCTLAVDGGMALWLTAFHYPYGRIERYLLATGS